MTKYVDPDFYRLVQIAREQCAGDNIQSKYTVQDSITKAIQYAESKEVPQHIRVKLKQCLIDMQNVKTYIQRLKIDDELCALLNSEIAEEKPLKETDE
jgi:hypothetical protein